MWQSHYYLYLIFLESMIRYSLTFSWIRLSKYEVKTQMYVINELPGGVIQEFLLALQTLL